MINLDFLEIGTSDFGTLIEEASDEAVGISIEPLALYLDNLPNKPNVKKINCAISLDNTEGIGKIYYITDDNIKKHNLPWWLRGCNSLGKYHPQHIERKIKHLVSIDDVPLIPLSKILKDNNVQGINLLKIDTEGCDCFILQSFTHYLNAKTKEYWPKIIQFESNSLSNKKIISSTIKIYESLGYILERKKDDTVLKLVV
jgi:FkbM family methyltransferase